MKRLEFVQNPLPGRLLEYPQDFELGEAFGEAEKFTINTGLRELVGDEPSRPTFSEWKPSKGGEGLLIVNTNFESKFLPKNAKGKIDSIELEINTCKDVGHAKQIESTIINNVLIHPSVNEVVYAKVYRELDQNGKITHQSIAVTHSMYNLKGDPSLSRHKGFDIEYAMTEPPVAYGDPGISAMISTFARQNILNEELTDELFPVSMSRLILSGQIIPLLEMIAADKTL